MNSSSDPDEQVLQPTPPEVYEKAQIASNSLLPEKSKTKYMSVYEQFMEWKKNHNATSFSENVFLAYFHELSEKYKPSTLWSKYSMLKSTIKSENDIDLSNYIKLTAFLKRQSDGFRSKKAKVLTANDVAKFINEAPDDRYLATKVALIFGITGACRRQELANITLKDIETHGETLLVKIPNTKNKIPRSFIVHGQFYDIVKKYQSQRTLKGKSARFFQNYQKGKCTAQVIGLNKFGNMPKEIATFLQLPDAECYTGHSFRRTSATLLADSGADTSTLKRHGGWRSSAVAESYVEDSIEGKVKIGNQITQAIHLKPPSGQFQMEAPRPSTSHDDVFQSDPHPHPSTSKPQPCFTPLHMPEAEHERIYEMNNSLSQTLNLPAKTFTVNLNNCTNCTVNNYITPRK